MNSRFEDELISKNGGMR